MSTVEPDAGGVVVISRVRPRNDQTNGPEEGETRDATAGMPKALVAFYSGEPEALGTTQIFTGVVLISFDITMAMIVGNFGILVYCSVPIWAGILFIISGSLSLFASINPTVKKVKASLVMNIFTSLAAACGMLMAALEIIMIQFLSPPVLYRTYCAYYKSDIQCLGNFHGVDVYYGFVLFNLALFVLMFCISISTSVFACKTVCRSSFQEINVVMYQTTSSVVSDPTRDVPPDSTPAFPPALKTQT